MIDIENKVIDTVAQAFETAGMDVLVSSDYIEKPASFPYLFIRQVSSAAYLSTLDERIGENHITVRFSLEVFSNKKGAQKTEAKAVMKIADEAMQNMKFTRTSYNYLPNYDRAIGRIRADYYAIVGRPQTIDGKTVYQMYR